MKSSFFYKNSLKQLGLFMLFALAIFASSCKRPTTDVGGDLIPEDDLLNVLQSDTMTILAETVKEDSLQTSDLSTVMLGTYVDPILGRTTASFYTQVTLSTSNPSFPTNAVVDSVVLALVYSNRLYGKINNQMLAVHRITEDLNPDSNYFNIRQIDYNLFDEIKPENEFYEMNPLAVVVVGTDTVKPQLRLKLRDQVGYDLLQTPASALSSSDAFKEYFKGFYVRPNIYFSDGGVFNFDLVDAASKLIVYYHYDENGTVENDFYDFTINTETSYYTSIEHRRFGTIVAPVMSGASVPGDELCYVQAGAGTRVRVEIPHIEDLNDLDGRSINRAQLVIPFEDESIFYPQAGLFLAYEDEEGELRILPDQLFGNISGTADFVADRYIFNISLYIQRVLNGEINSNGLFILSQNAGVSVARSVLHGPRYSVDDKNQNMRLILTYTH
ncbi:MAG: DUF4270 domain-containing protein [Flavobacteriales bacterium]|jgi:hypothetical protein